jgi:NAD+ synthase (glutamine-hydrolysing)
MPPKGKRKNTGDAADEAPTKKGKTDTKETKEASNGQESKDKKDLTMHEDLQKKLAEYRKKRNFNAKKWVAEKCKKFNEYLKKNGLKAAVVSISGGVDSAVTLALLAEAKKQKGSPLERIMGICQPIHSSGWALDRAVENAKAQGVEYVTVDQTDQHTRLVQMVDKAVGIEGKSFATGQLRSYMRTPVGYYVAQLLGQEGRPCVVMGTGNQDEDGYLAYFCKAGDGVVDVQLISDLHKSEVFKVGAQLKVPASTLQAPPSADLWPGQTDEEELGFSYDFVELFTGDYLKLTPDEQAAWKKELSPEGLKQFEAWSAAALKVHNRNKHKFVMPFNINVLKESSVEAD